MFNKNYSQYLKSSDGFSLYVCTNFDPKDYDAEEEVLIFNYGLICSNSHWEKQTSYFDQKGYKILIHNYRAHFNSQGEDDIERVTFQTISFDINTICEQLGIKKVVLFGHSMGVNVALEFTRRFPEKVVSQVLIAGTIFPPHDVVFNSQKMNFVFPVIGFVQKKFPDLYTFLFKTGGLNPLVCHFVHKFGYHTKETPREHIQVYLNRIGKLPSKLFVQLIKEMKDHDIINYLHEIKPPTLIISGDNDKVIPFSIQRIIQAKIPHSELYMVKDGSHVPQLDFPGSVNQRVALFLELNS